MTDTHEASDVSVGAAPLALPIAGEAHRSVAPEERIAWWRALLGPWYFMFRPSRCGFAVSRAPWFGLLAVLMGSILIGAMIIVLYCADEMYYRDWSGGIGSWEYKERSLIDAWATLATPDFPAVVSTLLILLFAVFWGIVASAVLGLTLLPIMHRFGGVMKSYRRTIVVGGAIVGPGSVAVACIGCLIVLVNNVHERRWQMGAARQWWEDYLEGFSFWLAFAFVGLLFSWLVRAAIGARSTEPLPDVPIRCEECGYDLTHLPEDGRCSECGIATAVSLVPAKRRVGVEWESRGSFGAWVNANWELIVRPKAFYQKLVMRAREARSIRFAFWNSVAIAVMSGLSLLGIYLTLEYSIDADEVIGFLSMGSIVPGVVSWAVHMAVGAMAGVIALSWRAEPVFAHVRKVWQYESSFLFVLWVYFMGFAWSVALFEDWMTIIFRELLGVRIFSVELVFVLVSIPGLLIVWLRRYRQAIAWTRWANY